MTISHHPGEATLMSYAAGSLGEALSALVAAHAAICPRCRGQIRDLELIGGVLLNQAREAANTPSRLAIPPLPEPATRSAGVRRARGAAGEDASGAMGLRLGIDLDQVRWRRLGPGVWHHPLPLSGAAHGDLRLLRVAPGQKVPEHGHGGTELTLVLKGAYRDSSGTFGVGDIEDVDDETQHQPIADADTGCICLLASERPARFKGWVSRLLQPLTGL